MSLINDALKQAKQTLQQNPPPAPPLQFRPVDTDAPTPPRGLLVFVGLALTLLVVILLMGALLWFVSQKTAGEVRVAARSVEEPVAAATTNSPVESAPTTTPPEAGTNSPAAQVTSAAPQRTVPSLQGIAFHHVHPSAIVNGRTVVVGDRVVGFRVLTITRESVTLGDDTATNVLHLSE